MLDHGLRVLLDKVVATAFLGGARRRRHQLRGVQQRRVEAGGAVLIHADIDAPAPLTVRLSAWRPWVKRGACISRLASSGSMPRWSRVCGSNEPVDDGVCAHARFVSSP